MTSSVDPKQAPGNAVLKSPPVRSHSESDAVEKPGLPGARPAMPRVATFTFNNDKKLFQGRNTKRQWKFAAQKTKKLLDPWRGLGMESLPEEKVTRHMYNPKNKKWKTDEIVVKIQEKVRMVTSRLGHLKVIPCSRLLMGP